MHADRYSDVLSRADLYAFASIVALNVGIGNNGGGGWENVFEIFEVGRETCTDITQEATNFPDAHLSPFSGSHDGSLADLFDFTEMKLRQFWVCTVLAKRSLRTVDLKIFGSTNQTGIYWSWITRSMMTWLIVLGNKSK
eukprot:UN01940